MKPVVDAGLAKIVEYDHHIVDGVRLEPTPGHSPGHCSIVLRSGNREALITGDFIYHPMQVCHPEVCGNLDWNFEIAIQTRRDILGRYAGTERMELGTHFADPTAVYIVQHDKGFRVKEA